MPTTAPYASSNLLRIQSVHVNEGAISATGDDSVEKVAFFGNASGTGASYSVATPFVYSSYDASLIAIASVDGATDPNAGFDAYDMTDPVIIGDVTGDGTLSATDASYVAQENVYLLGGGPSFNRPEIPDLPAPPLTASGLTNGPDPTLQIGNFISTTTGGVINVPVNVTDDFSGAQSVDLVIHYDTAQLDLANGDVSLGSLTAGWTLIPSVLDDSGVAIISMFTDSAHAPGVGSIVNLNFHVASDAPAGTSVLDIANPPSNVNGGFLPLTDLDGSFTLDVPAVVDLNGAIAGTDFTSIYDGVTPVAIADSAATISDAGSANLTQLTAAIVSPHAGDTLTVTTSGGITSSFAGGTLTLSGSDTLANYQAVLRTIKYQNTAGGPGVDTVTINVQVSDGLLSSNLAVATVTLPPILDLNGGTAGTSSTSGWFNSGAVGLLGVDSGDATAKAPAGLNLTSMTVVESSFHAGDVLAMTPITGISGLTATFSAGTLSITGSQTAANYQKILRLISYNNTSGGPGVSSFTATVTTSDGTLTSTPVTATINSTVLTGEVLGNRLVLQQLEVRQQPHGHRAGQRCLGDRTRQDRL